MGIFRYGLHGFLKYDCTKQQRNPCNPCLKSNDPFNYDAVLIT